MFVDRRDPGTGVSGADEQAGVVVVSVAAADEASASGFFASGNADVGNSGEEDRDGEAGRVARVLDYVLWWPCMG